MGYFARLLTDAVMDNYDRVQQQRHLEQRCEDVRTQARAVLEVVDVPNLDRSMGAEGAVAVHALGYSSTQVFDEFLRILLEQKGLSNLVYSRIGVQRVAGMAFSAMRLWERVDQCDLLDAVLAEIERLEWDFAYQLSDQGVCDLAVAVALALEGPFSLSPTPSAQLVEEALDMALGR